MKYNDLTALVQEFNKETNAGIKFVGVNAETLSAQFAEAAKYYAGIAEENGVLLNEVIQNGYRDLTGEELHSSVDGGTYVTEEPAIAPTTSRKITPSATPSELVANVPPPAKTARRQTAGKYPFDKMSVGESFFVPATEERPNPAKSMQSTVSSAVRKYSEVDPEGKTRINRNGKEVPVMIPTREFICRHVEDGAPWGFPGTPGAGVWRTA